MLNVVANDLDPHMAKICTVQVVLNSCIHRIPLKSVRVFNGNIITEYEEMNQGKHVLYHWLPNAHQSLYDDVVRFSQELKANKTKEPETA